MPVIETQVSTKQQRWIYRCKRCKVTVARDYTVTVHTEHFEHPVFHTLSSQTHRRYEPGMVNGLPLPELCPACKHQMSGSAVEGHFNPAVPCNSKCVGAVGHICECSCGGANHGGAHLH